MNEPASPPPEPATDAAVIAMREFLRRETARLVAETLELMVYQVAALAWPPDER